MYVNSLGRTTRTVAIGIAVIFVSAGMAQAATTIGTNITTGGTLSSGNATTSALYASADLSIGGNATTTATTGAFATKGNVTITGTLSSGNATTSALYASGDLSIGGNATTTAATGAFATQGNATITGTLGVTGATTLASTTATGMKVGQVGTRMTQIVTGYCVTDATSIAVATAIVGTSNFASSTQTHRVCTPSGGITLSGASSRVLVQATSTPHAGISVQSASSTAAGLIGVFFENTSTSTASTAVVSLNFWAFE